MDAIAQVPAHVWLVIHVAGLALALSSRSHLGPVCAVCTCVLLVFSTLIVAGVATVGFLYQQPFWAISGCTLGVMAVAAVFERSGHEHEALLQSIALPDEVS